MTYSIGNFYASKVMPLDDADAPTPAYLLWGWVREHFADGVNATDKLDWAGMMRCVAALARSVRRSSIAHGSRTRLPVCRGW